MSDYLTINEAAAFLKVSVKTLQNKKSKGVFKEGVHFVCPPHSRPRFKLSALVEWMEKGEVVETTNTDAIPKPLHWRYRQRG